MHADPAKMNKAISREKYEAMKAAMLHILADKALTHTELCNATTAYFARIPFEGNMIWYMESTKLDLEARGIIRRDAGKPQRYSLV